MTEEEARRWMEARDVPRGTLAAIDRFVDLLRVRSSEQNLVAASTLDSIWARHIVDSAQLLDLAPSSGEWLDLGSGAGFPGLIVAALASHPVMLVESRARRLTFLLEAVATMEIADRAHVIGTRVEMLAPQRAAVITARAFAPLPRLFEVAHHLSDASTVWILPKGRSAADELEAARGTWQCDAHMVPSITDASSAIIVATNVRRGKSR